MQIYAIYDLCEEGKHNLLFGSILKSYFIQDSLVCICNGHVKTIIQYTLYNHIVLLNLCFVGWMEGGGGIKNMLLLFTCIISLKDT